MIEFIIELVAGGLFELFAEIASGISRMRDRDRETDPRTPEATTPIELDPWSPVVQQSRNALTAKLLIGAAGGAAWGYYVSSSSAVDWPRTFWSFAVIGAVAFALRTAGFSNQAWASRINNRFVRGMLTFTPERFGSWAALRLVTALSVAGGFLVGS